MSGGFDGGDGVTWLAIMPSPLALTKCQMGKRQKVKTKSNEGKGRKIIEENTREGKIRTCIRTPGQGYYSLIRGRYLK